jgi:hypothetical protein
MRTLKICVEDTACNTLGYFDVIINNGEMDVDEDSCVGCWQGDSDYDEKMNTSWSYIRISNLQIPKGLS